MLRFLLLLLLFIVTEHLANADAPPDDFVAAVAVRALAAAAIGFGVALAAVIVAVTFGGAVASDDAADIAAVHPIAAADILANVAAANALSSG